MSSFNQLALKHSILNLVSTVDVRTPFRTTISSAHHIARNQLDISIILSSFIIIFLAEMPDKTMFSSIIMGSKMTPRWVFFGAALAFLFQVIISVTVGGFVSRIPKEPLNIGVGIVFIIGALLIVREILTNEAKDEEALAKKTAMQGGLRQFLIAFSVIFIAEFGDLTQIAAADLAAKTGNPLSVGVGSFVGLICITALGVYFGSTILVKFPIKPIQIISVIIMGGLGVVTLATAF